MFKNTILAVALTLGLGATAQAGDVIGNDVFNLGLGNVQSNLIADLTGVSFGNTVIDQTNVVNSASTVLDTGVAGDALFNDVVQIAAGNVQLNGYLKLSGLDVGNIDVTQTNATNVAQVDIDAWDDAVGNDVFQLSIFNPQANIIGIGEVIGAGNVTLAQTNVINSADVDIDIDSTDSGTFAGIEFAAFNDITQIGIATFQANVTGLLSGVSIGNVTLDQVNALNVAALNITDSEAMLFNDVVQLAGFTVQNNSLLAVQGISVGNLDVSQTNVVNSGSLTGNVDQDGASGIALAVGNDIFQSVDFNGNTPVSQTNAVVALAGLGFGNTTIDQLNGVNLAELDIDGNGSTGFIGNDVIQLATGPLGHVTQDNSITMGSLIDVGAVAFTQTNAVNSASLDLSGSAFALGNDIIQIGTGISQSNSAIVAAVGSVGPMTIGQVNAINVASLVITP